MTKYSSDLKIRVVQAYRNGEGSQRELAKQYKVNRQAIREWIQLADEHGLQSVKVRKTKRVFSQTQKIKVVRYALTHEVSLSATAAHFGINRGVLFSWMKIVEEQGVAGLRPKPKGRKPKMAKQKRPKAIKKLAPTEEENYQQRILELETKLHQTELDRDILKALATITQAKKNNLRRK